MFANPSTPNIADFYAFCLGQQVPAADLPAGTLTTVAIATDGTITAASTTGTVQAGEVLFGAGIPTTGITAWSGTSGTVSPAPASAVSAATAEAYSQYAVWALNYALEVALPGPGIGAGISGMAGQYVLAVYALGLHELLQIAEDQPNQNFFVTTREKYNIGTLQPGVILASGDEATSETLVVPEFFKTLTLSELDLLKTPYGRRYMQYSQMYGPTIVGFS